MRVYWLIAVVTLGLCGCSTPKEQAGPDAGVGGQAQTLAESVSDTGDPAILRVLLDRWNGSVDADLAAGTLVSARIEYQYDNPVSGTPSGSTTIPGIDTTLSAAQREAIASFVGTSGFLDLEDAYGAPEGQRYYPTRIVVSFSDGSAKEVLFRSNPEYGEPPAAFQKLEAYLDGLPQSAGE